MTTNSHGLTTRTAVAAGRGALIAIVVAAGADLAIAQTVQEATKPASTVEVAGGGVTDGSYKAGEYNGLQKKGAFGIGQIDFRGGGAFDSDSALRWRIKGADLGLETRSLSAEVGVQGRYRFNVGYDELRRNRSDTYQTLYNGAGTTSLTLPATWQVPTVAGSSNASSSVNVVSARGLVPSIGKARYIDARAASPTFGGLLAPTATQTGQVDAAANADVPLFDNFNLSTKRTRVDLGFNYNFDARWGVDASFRPEHKEGLKPMGTVSRNTGADISAIIPDVVDTDTNQVDLRMNFKGEKSFAQAAYYGSFFNNNVVSMSWQNWATGPAGTGTLNTMSSAPDNAFNQISATGGVNFSPTTKLVANGSYARNTQNGSFLTDTTTLVVPVNSLNGLVVSEAFNAKLTAKPAKALRVTTAYKYDNRDNRTAVSIFQYSDVGEAPSPNANFPAGPSNPYGPVLAQNANANRSYSKKINQFNADADYAVAKRQWLKGGYEFQRINRECYTSWISCADAAVTNENTLRTEWRTNVTDDLTARIGYAFSARRTPNYNENAFLALVPYANVSPATATGGATAYSFLLANGWNGWGPALGYAATTGNMSIFFPSNNALANASYGNGNRISELPGMRRYYVSDRDRNKLRAAANWQATAQLSFQAGVDYNKDHYPDAIYGLQDSDNWAVNADSGYAVATDVSVDVFYTYEDLRGQSAGNTYTGNTDVAVITGGQAGAIGLSGNACDTYTTLQQRNNNNKLDPCLNWFTDRRDKAHTVGIGLLWKNVSDKPLDLTGNFVLTRARSDTNVTGGNWANNPVIGPGGPPTTTAAFFLAAVPLPTVSTDTAEVRVSGKYIINTRQAVRVSYTYMRMKSADWAYEGMQLGTMSGVLPSNEQPFNYNVHVIGAAYVLIF